MFRNTGRRLLTWMGLLTAGTVAVVAPGSAVGAEPSNGLSVEFGSMLVTPKSPGERSSVRLVNPSASDVLLDDVTVSIDAAGVADFLTVTAEQGFNPCKTSGTVTTCDVGTQTVRGRNAGHYLVGVTVKPLPKPKVGQKGKLRVTVSAKGHAPLSKEGTVEIAEGVNLSASAQPEQRVEPGASADLATMVRNSGETAVTGTVMEAHYSPTLEPTTRFRNCSYGTFVVTCFFSQTLVPGRGYRVASLPYRVRKDTPAPMTVGSTVHWLTADEAKLRREGSSLGNLVPGDGPTLDLVEQPAQVRVAAGQKDVVPQDNLVFPSVSVIGENVGDLEAVGTTVRGAVGTTVKLGVGLHNRGPARAGFREGPAAAVLITVPTGTAVVSVPRDCVPAPNGKPTWEEDKRYGAPQYFCYVESLFIEVDETPTFVFDLRIDNPGPSNGDVRIVYPNTDPVPANNTAAILVNPAGGAESGGQAGGVGALPLTGRAAGPMAGAAAMLVALGGVGFVVARRKRVRFQA